MTKSPRTPREFEKFGWRVSEWATAVGCSRSSTYELIDKGIITSVKFGGARIVTTHPREFLAYCAEHPDPLQRKGKARIAALKRIA